MEEGPRIIVVTGLLRTSDHGYEIFVDRQVRWQLDIVERAHPHAGHFVRVEGRRVGRDGLKVLFMERKRPRPPYEDFPSE